MHSFLFRYLTRHCFIFLTLATIVSFLFPAIISSLHFKSTSIPVGPKTNVFVDFQAVKISHSSGLIFIWSCDSFHLSESRQAQSNVSSDFYVNNYASRLQSLMAVADLPELYGVILMQRHPSLPVL